MPVTKQQEKKVEKPKRWIFKSLDDHTLIVKGTTREERRGPSGVRYEKVIPPIKIVFNNGTFELNEHVAQAMGHPIEDLAALILDNEFIGRKFKLIWAPDMDPDEALLKYSKDADKEAEDRQPRVMHGDRATGARGR